MKYVMGLLMVVGSILTGFLPVHAVELHRVPINGVVTDGIAQIGKHVLYGDFVQVSFWINPELAGQTPSKTVNWIENDWHKDRIAANSDKALYLNKFVSWARQVPAAYNMALRGNYPRVPLAEFPDLAK